MIINEWTYRNDDFKYQATITQWYLPHFRLLIHFGYRFDGFKKLLTLFIYLEITHVVNRERLLPAKIK
jgi:hypothetical protein